MKATLSQAAMNVAYAAANNSGGKRPVLSNVRIGNGEIAGCDGYIMARCPVETVPESSEMILVGAGEIVKARKESKAEALVIETVGEGKAEAKITAPGTEYVKHIKLTEATYPSIDQIPPQGERKAYVALGFGLLTKMLKIADIENSPFVKIKIRGEREPVEIVSHNTKIYIMPVAVREEDDV